MSDYSIQIELEGLIRILAQNLYANPDVFLREMIQNAHDAITKRRLLYSERGERALPPPQIRIDADTINGRLIVSDNGIGLNKDEIHQYLATIGKSGTNELKNRLLKGDKAGSIDLIGQFGIGLLSAFIVSESVEIITKSSMDRAYRWVSNGGKTYQIEEYEREEVGSTLVLNISRDNTRYLNYDYLKKIIKTYADIIGIPIFLGKDNSPVNEVDAPWHKKFFDDKEEREDYLDYWQKRFKSEVPLDVWPVSEDFSFVNEQGEVEMGMVKGVLGITDRNLPSIDTRGSVDLFIYRMFITSSYSEILPTWARFIQGVIECNNLTPNAARDNIIRNEILNKVREKVGVSILNRLKFLFNEDKYKFSEIMRWHNGQILTMCALPEHQSFFESIADYIPLPSTRGYITIPEYLNNGAEKNGLITAYYFTQPDSSSQYQLLADAQDVNAFDATNEYTHRFLQRYVNTWPNKIKLQQLDSDSEELFEKVSKEEAEKYSTIEVEFNRIPDVKAVLSKFRPKEVPVLIMESQSSKARREIQTLAEDVAIPFYMKDKIKKHLDASSDPTILHVNVDNEIISLLAGRANLSDDFYKSAITSLYNNAVMLHSRNITANNIKIMFDQYNHVINNLLLQKEQNENLRSYCNNLEMKISTIETENSPDSSRLTKWVSCFVAMPFKNPLYDAIYKALERVLEDEPFFWNVIRADEEIIDSRLWSNVEQLMLSSHCFIAEVSDQNPNVMIEIGRMEVLQRPLLLIKKKGSPELPSDIKERLFIEYDDSDATLVENLKNQMLEQKRFISQQGEKYLSQILLEKIDGLSEKACQKISKEFHTCDSFMQTSSEEVARKLGFNPLIVQVAKEGIEQVVHRNANYLISTS